MAHCYTNFHCSSRMPALSISVFGQLPTVHSFLFIQEMYSFKHSCFINWFLIQMLWDDEKIISVTKLTNQIVSTQECLSSTSSRVKLGSRRAWCRNRLEQREGGEHSSPHMHPAYFPEHGNHSKRRCDNWHSREQMGTETMCNGCVVVHATPENLITTTMKPRKKGHVRRGKKLFLVDQSEPHSHPTNQGTRNWIWVVL